MDTASRLAPFKPKRIFITGIAGFIGFHLALHLSSQGHFVIGCDNFNTYYDVQLKKGRQKLLEEKNIPIIESDIRNSALLEKLMLEKGITHLVHLAAQAGVRHSINHPESYVESNLDGFVKILQICRTCPGIKFIYASSSSVYGLNKKIPFSESDPTDSPASFYGATKKANELIASSYHHLYGIPVTGLRFFTVYGPWGRPDMAYFSFTNAILKGEPIHVYNQGQMKRDFTYIDDIVQGITAAIELGAKCEIFNLGNHRSEDLMQLIALIENKLGKKAIKEFLPMQSGDVPVTYADISKSQNMLGFNPITSLDEGIEKFINWYLASYKP